MRVVQLRGGHVESVHPFSAVAVRDGEVVGRLGEPVGSTWRSAAKPFQLWCSLEALGDPELADEELAVGASSHTAEPRHLELVRRLLDRFELSVDDLRCAPHPPLHQETAHAYLREGRSFSDLHNNCSGKHAFLVAAARTHDSTLDYRDPKHPLQARLIERVEHWSGFVPGLGFDGCSAPTFHLPLEGFARAWSLLAAPPDERLARIARAVEAHPWLVSGTGRIDHHLAAGRRETTLTKIGAQALFNLAFPERRLGVAIKVHSGYEPALAVAIEHTLHALVPGAWKRPSNWPFGVLRNVAGSPVGELLVEA